MLSSRLTDDAELRALEPWNAEEFTAHIRKVREYVGAWIPWVNTIGDTEAGRAFLQRYANRHATDDGSVYGIWLDGKLVGGVAFRVFSPATGVCELGAWLDPDAVGRGLITRAARCLIDWAIGVRGMSRVEWQVLPSNSRSIAVARRLGMSKEGVLRAAFPLGGKRHDVEMWSLVASEWTGGKA